MKHLFSRIYFASLIILLISRATVDAKTKTASLPAEEYLAFAISACDNAQRQLPEITRIAEVVARRHIAGGVIGTLWDEGWCKGQGLDEELVGRSGQIMHIGFGRALKQNRTDDEKTNDVLIAGWIKDPGPDDLKKLKEFKNRKAYIIGLGPRERPALAEHVALCDAWLDTGYGSDDRVVTFQNGFRAGHANMVSDTINAWALMGEVIAALTRDGKMPPIAKSYSYEDGRDWWNKYFQKQLFQDDCKVAALPAGQLGRAYVNHIRELLQTYKSTQLPAVRQTADLIAAEYRKGNKTVVAEISHMVWAVTATEEAAEWAIPSIETVYAHLPEQWDTYYKATADGALVLRLGYSGFHRDEQAVFKKKNQRVMLIAAENPRPEWQLPADLLTYINMGWAFGDACVEIPGYPINALPPSGVMQVVAYETVNVEVLARLHAHDPAKRAKKE